MSSSKRCELSQFKKKKFSPEEGYIDFCSITVHFQLNNSIEYNRHNDVKSCNNQWRKKLYEEGVNAGVFQSILTLFLKRQKIQNILSDTAYSSQLKVQAKISPSTGMKNQTSNNFPKDNTVGFRLMGIKAVFIYKQNTNLEIIHSYF